MLEMEKGTLRTKSSNSQNNRKEVGEQPKPKDNFRVEDLKINLEKISDHSDQEPVYNVLIAFKSRKCYAIGTNPQRLMLIENFIKIYSGRFLVDSKEIQDIVYIDHLDCYILNYDYKLYRKDIDNSPPYLYMNLDSGWRTGKCFKYSRLNQRLLIPKDGHNIAIVNLERKRVEIEISRRNHRIFREFKLIGPKENKITSLTLDGIIYLYSVSYDLKKVTAWNSHQLQLIDSRDEYGDCFAACDRGRYLLVNLVERLSSHSRVLLLEVKGHSLVQLAVVDESPQDYNFKINFEFYQGSGSSMLWVGFGSTSAHIYEADIESGELRELVEKRRNHKESHPLKIERIGEQFYYTGRKHTIMRLTLKI